MSRVALVVLLATLVACAGAARRANDLPTWEKPGLGGSVRPEMGSPQPGEAAPEFDLVKSAGGSLRLSSLRGSWVVLHFTGTWCPYCDAEIKHLGEIADAYGPRNVRVLVVDLEEEHDLWQAYSKDRLSKEIVALEDHTGDTAKRYAPPGAQPSFRDRSQVLFDSTLVIDPQGMIRLFLLPDSAHFDPTFRAVRSELDRMLGGVASLSPEDVVGIDARATRTGSAGEITVRLDIAAGYHIMSDQPTSEFSIPTVVRAEPTTNIAFAPTKYPTPQTYQLGDSALSTFSGSTVATIPLSIATPEGASVQVVVRTQACTVSRCLSPVTRTVRVDLPIEQ